MKENREQQFPFYEGVGYTVKKSLEGYGSIFIGPDGFERVEPWLTDSQIKAQRVARYWNGFSLTISEE